MASVSTRYSGSNDLFRCYKICISLLAATKLVPQSEYRSVQVPLREMNRRKAAKKASTFKLVTASRCKALVHIHMNRHMYPFDVDAVRSEFVFMLIGPA